MARRRSFRTRPLPVPRGPRRIDIPEPSFYFRPEWSPDGAKLAFTDTHYRLLVPVPVPLQGRRPLVGTRTWGGLVGTWDTPPLIDGGGFVAPRGGFIDVDGEWAVEAEGVAPDIEVRNDPAPVIAGGDPQLEAAVREALRLLETERVTFAEEPAPPVRWRRPER